MLCGGGTQQIRYYNDAALVLNGNSHAALFRSIAESVVPQQHDTGNAFLVQECVPCVVLRRYISSLDFTTGEQRSCRAVVLVIRVFLEIRGLYDFIIVAMYRDFPQHPPLRKARMLGEVAQRGVE